MIKSTPDKNEIVKDAIQFLVNQFINNGNIENKDILSSIDKFMIDEKVKNQNVTDIIKTPKKSIIPRSEKQKEYVRALRQSDIGKIVHVRINNSNRNTLFGEIIINSSQRVA